MSRHDTGEVPSSAKESHKGFLSKFVRHKKKDDSQPSPDESSIDSPTSPASHRHAAAGLFGKSGLNSSETSLNERPRSSQTDSERMAVGRARAGTREGERRFAFVTPDGWNYRLVDITLADSASRLREIICEG